MCRAMYSCGGLGVDVEDCVLLWGAMFICGGMCMSV